MPEFLPNGTPPLVPSNSDIDMSNQISEINKMENNNLPEIINPYSDQINKESKSLLPSNTYYPTSRLDSVKGYGNFERNPFFVPEASDIDNIRDQAIKQSTGEWWKHTAAKFGITTKDAFVNDFEQIGRDYDAVSSGDIFKLFSQENNLKKQEELRNKYPTYGTGELDDHWARFIPGNFGRSDFGGEFLPQLGFSAGTLLSTLVQNAALTFVTGGIGSELAALRAARGTGKAVQGLKYLFETAHGITNFKRAKAALENIQTTKNILGTTLNFGKNSLKVLANSYMLYKTAASEAAFEANNSFSENFEELKQKFIENNGYEPIGEDLDKIRQQAATIGLSTFGWNMPILLGSNLAQFGNILRPFKSRVINETIKDGLEVTGKGLSKAITKKVVQEAESKWLKGFKSFGKAFLEPMSEGLEEVGQSVVANATADYYKDVFEGLTPNSVFNLKLNSIQDYLGTKAFAEDFVGGFFGGAIFKMVGKAGRPLQNTKWGEKYFGESEKTKAEKRDQLLAETADILNSVSNKDILKYLFDPEIQNHISQFKTKEKLITAAEQNDRLGFNDARGESIRNLIYSGLKTGKLDLALSRLEVAKELNNDELAEALEIDETSRIEVAQQKAISLIDSIKERAKQMESDFNNINLKYKNQFEENSSAHLMYEEAKKSLLFKIDQLREDKKHVNKLRRDTVETTNGVIGNTIIDQAVDENELDRQIKHLEFVKTDSTDTEAPLYKEQMKQLEILKSIKEEVSKKSKDYNKIANLIKDLSVSNNDKDNNTEYFLNFDTEEKLKRIEDILKIEDRNKQLIKDIIFLNNPNNLNVLAEYNLEAFTSLLNDVKEKVNKQAEAIVTDDKENNPNTKTKTQPTQKTDEILEITGDPKEDTKLLKKLLKNNLIFIAGKPGKYYVALRDESTNSSVSISRKDYASIEDLFADINYLKTKVHEEIPETEDVLEILTRAFGLIKDPNILHSTSTEPVWENKKEENEYLFRDQTLFFNIKKGLLKDKKVVAIPVHSLNRTEVETKLFGTSADQLKFITDQAFENGKDFSIDKDINGNITFVYALEENVKGVISHTLIDVNGNKLSSNFKENVVQSRLVELTKNVDNKFRVGLTKESIKKIQDVNLQIREKLKKTGFSVFSFGISKGLPNSDSKDFNPTSVKDSGITNKVEVGDIVIAKEDSKNPPLIKGRPYLKVKTFNSTGGFSNELHYLYNRGLTPEEQNLILELIDKIKNASYTKNEDLYKSQEYKLLSGMLNMVKRPVNKKTQLRLGISKGKLLINYGIFNEKTNSLHNIFVNEIDDNFKLWLSKRFHSINLDLLYSRDEFVNGKTYTEYLIGSDNPPLFFNLKKKEGSIPYIQQYAIYNFSSLTGKIENLEEYEKNLVKVVKSTPPVKKSSTTTKEAASVSTMKPVAATKSVTKTTSTDNEFDNQNFTEEYEKSLKNAIFNYLIDSQTNFSKEELFELATLAKKKGVPVNKESYKNNYKEWYSIIKIKDPEFLENNLIAYGITGKKAIKDNTNPTPTSTPPVSAVKTEETEEPETEIEDNQEDGQNDSDQDENNQSENENIAAKKADIERRLRIKLPAKNTSIPVSPKTWGNRKSLANQLSSELKGVVERGVSMQEWLDKGYGRQLATWTDETIIEFLEVVDIERRRQEELKLEKSFEGQRGQADLLKLPDNYLTKGEWTELRNVNISQDTTMPDYRSGRYKVVMISVNTDFKDGIVTFTNGNEVITPKISDLINAKYDAELAASEQPVQAQLKEVGVSYNSNENAPVETKKIDEDKPEVFDADDDDENFKLSIDEENSEGITEEEIKEFKRILSQVGLSLNPNLLRKLGDYTVWGSFKKDIVSTFKGAAKGTLYHEAFEVVFNAILDKKNQQRLINEFKKRPGTFVTWKGETKLHSEASFLEAKEAIADGFIDYKENNKIELPKTLIGKFYFSLISFLKKFINMFFPSVNRTYELIDRGVFTKTKLKTVTDEFFRIKNLTEHQSNEFHKSISYLMFKHLDDKLFKILENVDLDNVSEKELYDEVRKMMSAFYNPQTEEEKKLRGIILGKRSWYILNNQNLTTDKIKANDEAIEEYYRARDLMLPLLQNDEDWNQIVKSHKNFMRDYDFIFEEDITDEYLEQKENKNRNDYTIDRMKVNVKNSIPKSVKYLLATLSEQTIIETVSGNHKKVEIPSDVSLLPKISIDNNILFNKILSRLSGYNGAETIRRKLFEISEITQEEKKFLLGSSMLKYKAQIRELYRKLFDKTVDEVESRYELSLYLKTLNSFQKVAPNFLKFRVGQESSYFVNEATQRTSEEMKRSARSWILTQRYKTKNNFWLAKDSSKNFYINKKIDIELTKNKEENTNAYLNVLHNLGFIEINKEFFESLDFDENWKITEALKFIVATLNTHYDNKTRFKKFEFGFLGIAGNLNTIAEIFAAKMMDGSDVMQTNAENSRYSKYIDGNFFTQIINDINSLEDDSSYEALMAEFLDKHPYYQDYYSKDSILLKNLLNKRLSKEKITPTILNGLQFETDSGKTASSLEEIDFYMLRFNASLETRRHKPIFTVLENADSNLDYAIQLDKYYEYYVNTENIGKIAENHLKAEIASAVSFIVDKNSDRNNNKELNKEVILITGETRKLGTSLQIYADILPPDIVKQIHNLIDEVKETDDPEVVALNIISNFKTKDLGLYVKEFVSKKAEKQFKYLEQNGFISLREDNNTYNMYGIMDGLFLDTKYGTKDQIMGVLKDQQLNYLIHNIETFRLFFGSPIYYKDALKRFKNFLSPRLVSENSTEVNGAMNKLLNDSIEYKPFSLQEVSSANIPYEDKTNHKFSKNLNIVAVNDIETYNEDLAEFFKNFARNNSTDAQMFSPLPFIREMMWKSSKWNEKRERLYQIHMAYTRLRLSEKHPKHYQYSSEDLKKRDENLLEPYKLEDGSFDIPSLDYVSVIKPIGSGFKANVSHQEPFLIKTSVLPLTYHLVEGTKFEKIFLDMFDNSIGGLLYNSAYKVGEQKDAKNIINHEGKVQLPSQIGKIEQIPFNTFNLQVETQTEKNKGTIGTQNLSILGGNVYHNGVPYDFEFEGDDVQRHAQWNSLTEEQKQKASKAYVKEKRHTESIKNLFDVYYEEFLHDFGIEKNDDNSLTIKNKEKLYSSFFKYIEKNNLPNHILEQLQLNEDKTDFIVPLEMMQDYESFKHILYSIIDKRVLSLKLNGGQKIQISSVLLAELKNTSYKVYFRKKDNKKSKENKWELLEDASKFNPEIHEYVISNTGLKSYRKDKEGNILPMQVMISSRIKKEVNNFRKANDLPLLSDKELLKWIKENQPMLSKGIGFRIPGQELSSIDSFEIVGFLPDYLGDAVAVPDTLTTKTGSDFDVDKLNTYLYNYKINSNGYPIFINYDTSNEPTNQIKRYVKYVNHLASKNVYKEDSFEEHISEIEEKNKILNETYEQTKEKIEKERELRLNVGKILFEKLPNYIKQLYFAEEEKLEDQDLSGILKTVHYLAFTKNLLSNLNEYSIDNEDKAFLMALQIDYEKNLELNNFSKEAFEKINKLSEEYKTLKDNTIGAMLTSAEIIAEEFNIEDFDQFIAKPIHLQNSKEAVENEYFQSMSDIILAKENFENLISPNSSVEFEQTNYESYTNKILRLKGEATESNKLYSLDIFTDFIDMIKKRLLFLRSKENVGIMAVGNTSHANFQKFLGFIDYSFKAKQVSKDSLLWNSLGIVFSHNSIRIGEKEYPSLSGLKSNEIDNILRYVSKFINGAVDATKDDWLSRYGAFGDAAGVAVLGLKIGMHPYQIGLMLNHPFVKEVLRIKAIKKSPIGKLNPTVIEKYSKLNSNEDYLSYFIELVGNQPLEKLIDEKDIKKIEKHIQLGGANSDVNTLIEEGKNLDLGLAVLKQFLQMNELSYNILSTIQTANHVTTNLNSNVITPVKESNFNYLKKNSPIRALNDKNEVVSAAEMLRKNSYSERLIENLNTLHDVVHRDILMKQTGELIDYTIATLSNDSDIRLFEKSTQKTIKKIQSDMVNMQIYSAITPSMLSENGGKMYEHIKKIFLIDSPTFKRLEAEKIKAISKSSFEKDMDGTYIFDYLSLKPVDENSGYWYLDVIKTPRDIANLIYYSLKRLQETKPQIFSDLMMTTILQNGNEFNKNNLISFLPPNVYQELTQNVSMIGNMNYNLFSLIKELNIVNNPSPDNAFLKELSNFPPKLFSISGNRTVDINLNGSYKSTKEALDNINNDVVIIPSHRILKSGETKKNWNVGSKYLLLKDYANNDHRILKLVPIKISISHESEDVKLYVYKLMSNKGTRRHKEFQSNVELNNHLDSEFPTNFKSKNLSDLEVYEIVKSTNFVLKNHIGMKVTDVSFSLPTTLVVDKKDIKDQAQIQEYFNDDILAIETETENKKAEKQKRLSTKEGIYNELGDKTGKDILINPHLANSNSYQNFIIAKQASNNNFYEEFNKFKTVGNPFEGFSKSPTGKTSIKEDTLNFIAWLIGTEHTDIYQMYRDSLLANKNLIRNSVLVYKTEHNEPNYVTALNWLFNNPDSPLYTSNKVENNKETEPVFKTLDKVPEAEKVKAVFKFSNSIGLISFGKEGSSSDYYVKQYKEKGLPVNPEKYLPGRVYFATQNGDGYNREKTVEEIIRALDSGAKVLLDSKSYIDGSNHNKEGEGWLYERLNILGYKQQKVSNNDTIMWYKDTNELKNTKAEILNETSLETQTKQLEKQFTIDYNNTWEELKKTPVYSNKGVNIMRSEVADPDKHFGNLFSEGGYAGTIKVDSIGEAKDAYKKWLLGENVSDILGNYFNKKNIDLITKAEKRRQWILNEIRSGKLDNATLLYTAKLNNRGQGNHGEALMEVVNQIRGEKQSPKSNQSTASNIKPKNISTPENPIQVYSDGSDIKGTGKIGFGAVFEHNGTIYDLSGTENSPEVTRLKQLFPDAKFSNPTMEMMALVSVLNTFKNSSEHIVINQDYKGAVNYGKLWNYSEGSNQREPKPWKAKELYIKKLVESAENLIEKIIANGGSVKIQWVKGHSGNKMNDLADAAAKNRDIFNNFSNVYENIDIRTVRTDDLYVDKNKRLKIQYPKNIEFETVVGGIPSSELIKASNLPHDNIIPFVKGEDYEYTISKMFGQAAARYVNDTDSEISKSEGEWLKSLGSDLSNNFITDYLESEAGEDKTIQEFAKYLLDKNKKIIDTAQLSLFDNLDLPTFDKNSLTEDDTTKNCK